MQINIQFLRFIAALSVLLYHAGPHYVAAGGSAQNMFISAISWFGYAGVDVFFVISGYIMWVSTRSANTTRDVGRFLYKRITRIYLGYWPYFFLALLLTQLYNIEHTQPIDYAGSFFLTQPQSRFLLLAVSWSLTYELYFYLCFACLLLLPRHKQPAFLSMGLFLVLITLMVYWMVDHDTLRHHARWILKGSRFFLSPYCAEFIGGCLLAVYFERSRSIPLSLCWIVLIGMGTMAVMFQQHSAEGAKSLLDYPQKRVAFFGPAAIALVALMVELEKRGRLFPYRVSLLLGGASYSLYLSHTILLEGFYHAGFRTQLANWANAPAYGRECAILLFILAILAYSIWHYQRIEKPLTAMARKLLGK